MDIKLRCDKYKTCEEDCTHKEFHEEEDHCTFPIKCGECDAKCVPKKKHSSRFQKTKAGLGLCPFFTWVSERIGLEEDVSLTHCAHSYNPNDCEGNCNEKDCPLIKE